MSQAHDTFISMAAGCLSTVAALQNNKSSNFNKMFPELRAMNATDFESTATANVNGYMEAL